MCFLCVVCLLCVFVCVCVFVYVFVCVLVFGSDFVQVCVCVYLFHVCCVLMYLHLCSVSWDVFMLTCMPVNVCAFLMSAAQMMESNAPEVLVW